MVPYDNFISFLCMEPCIEVPCLEQCIESMDVELCIESMDVRVACMKWYGIVLII